MIKTILFVYGSLKRGYRNHRLLADQDYLGDAITEPHYRILDLGTYPGMIHDPAMGLNVRGELWAVNACALAELDEFEGEEGLYARSPVNVVGQEQTQAYFWTGVVPADVRSGNAWPFPSAGGETQHA